MQIDTCTHSHIWLAPCPRRSCATILGYSYLSTNLHALEYTGHWGQWYPWYHDTMLIYVGWDLALYPMGKKKKKRLVFFPSASPSFTEHFLQFTIIIISVPCQDAGSPQCGRRTPCSAGTLLASQCSPQPFCGPTEVWGSQQLVVFHMWTEHDQFGGSHSAPGFAVTSASAHSVARQSQTGSSLFFLS